MLALPNVLLFAPSSQHVPQLRALLAPYLRLEIVLDEAAFQRMLKAERYDAVFYVSSFSSRLESPLRELRNRHPEVPVIVLAGSAALQECAEALEAGAFDFLVPPYGQRELLAVVEQALASTQARGWHSGG